MKPIEPPRHDGDYPDRNLDCQEALEDMVQELVGRAEAAGWSMSDIAPALVDLADNLRLQRAAIAHTEAIIRDLKR